MIDSTYNVTTESNDGAPEPSAVASKMAIFSYSFGNCKNGCQTISQVLANPLFSPLSSSAFSSQSAHKSALARFPRTDRSELDRMIQGPNWWIRRRSSYASYDWFFFTDMAAKRHGLEQLGFRVELVSESDERAMHAAVNASQTDASEWLTRNKARLLTKWYKFGHVPAVLHNYSYLVHVDASVYTKRNWNHYNIPSPDQEVKCLLTNFPNVAVFVGNHPGRKRVYQEHGFTLKLGMETQSHIDAFERDIEEQLGTTVAQSTPLFRLGLWIRKLSNDTGDVDRAFEQTFATMVKFGLARGERGVLNIYYALFYHDRFLK